MTEGTDLIHINANKCQHDLAVVYSKGASRTRAPNAPNSFVFMQFAEKRFQDSRLAQPLCKLAPPLGNPGSITASYNYITDLHSMPLEPPRLKLWQQQSMTSVSMVTRSTLFTVGNILVHDRKCQSMWHNPLNEDQSAWLLSPWRQPCCQLGLTYDSLRSTKTSHSVYKLLQK